MMVTGASALPSARSGRGPGRINSSTVGSAKASEVEPIRAAVARTAPLAATNSRREMRKGNPLLVRPTGGAFDILKGRMWQRRGFRYSLGSWSHSFDPSAAFAGDRSFLQ